MDKIYFHQCMQALNCMLGVYIIMENIRYYYDRQKYVLCNTKFTVFIVHIQKVILAQVVLPYGPMRA